MSAEVFNRLGCGIIEPRQPHPSKLMMISRNLSENGKVTNRDIFTGLQTDIWCVKTGGFVAFTGKRIRDGNWLPMVNGWFPKKLPQNHQTDQVLPLRCVEGWILIGHRSNGPASEEGLNPSIQIDNGGILHVIATQIHLLFFFWLAQ